MLEALYFRVVCLSFHYWDNQPADFPFVRPSVHPKIFLGIFLRTHGRTGLKFGMLMYTGHLQSWLNFVQDLSIFLILEPLWFETGQIWGFQLFLHNKRNYFIFKQQNKKICIDFTLWRSLKTSTILLSEPSYFYCVILFISLDTAFALIWKHFCTSWVIHISWVDYLG